MQQPTLGRGAGARPRKTLSIVASLALALASLALGGEAEAQRRGGIALDELELVRTHDRGRAQRYAIRYGLVGHARPGAQLHITVGQHRRAGRSLVANLTERRGLIPVGRIRGHATIEVRAQDARGRMLPIRLGRGATLAGVELATELASDRVHRARPARPSRPARPVQSPALDPFAGSPSLSAVDQACDDAFIGQQNEDRCLRIMRSEPRAEATIAACDTAFIGQDTALECLEARATPAQVSRCDDAFVGDDAAMRCLRTAAGARVTDAHFEEVLRVCERRVGDDATLACVADLLASSPRRPARRARR